MIKDLDENKGDLLLKPNQISPETDLESTLTLEAYQNFCTNENNNEIKLSNKEKMKPVTTLEELF